MQGLWVSGLFLLPFLGWNTVTDLKWRRISPASLLLFGAPVILLFFSEHLQTALLGSKEDGWFFLCGILPGVFLLVLSIMTEGAIGRGDGLVSIVLGCYLGIWRVLLLLMGAFLLGAVFGGILLLCKKADRKTSLPFLPFLLGAYLMMFAAGLCGTGG